MAGGNSGGVDKMDTYEQVEELAEMGNWEAVRQWCEKEVTFEEETGKQIVRATSGGLIKVDDENLFRCVIGNKEYDERCKRLIEKEARQRYNIKRFVSLENCIMPSPLRERYNRILNGVVMLDNMLKNETEKLFKNQSFTKMRGRRVINRFLGVLNLQIIEVIKRVDSTKTKPRKTIEGSGPNLPELEETYWPGEWTQPNPEEWEEDTGSDYDLGDYDNEGCK